ncbi:MAG: [protein-PII] uridylyltransferase [Candidatus Endonucleobacter bathymodioli]|uniref:Bifunctional uridylyltransferase/uridylyl-removing enzyme n=1 Tax=Candidatus Endonucleibacter bathymodioli TaxID=539814 RepID=A0AA90NQW4_9GAMM|nr:[protein-PII] uridylyltransferase [Candidatus Endonucleobacter bathymodioli]
METLFQNLTPEIKQILFSKGQFRADLTLSPSSPVSAYKKCLGRVGFILDRWFREKVDISILVAARAWAIDQILSLAWDHYKWADTIDISLLAVGGYGRGEQHPGSDIDILILLDNDQYDTHHRNIEAFLALLWDIGLIVGSSVRSVSECTDQARLDLSIITSLMESRIISGPSHLYDRLQQNISTDKMWSSEIYLRAKFDEQRNLYRKSNDTYYILEPNVKSSPGGLRDLHMLGWVARRHYGTFDPVKLGKLKFLTKEEYRLLIKCRDFLWKVRWGLHTLNNRCEDRLLFDYQQILAEKFGYMDNKSLLAVEQFMKNYFRVVMSVTQLKDLLLQHFDDDILHGNRANKIIPINECFQIRNNYIETTHSQVFVESPAAMLEIFVLITRNPDIIGLRARTIRQLRRHGHLIDRRFQSAPRCTRLFLELMRAPYSLTSTLRRMVRYGILGRYLPEFGRIIGQMQFDLFHSHTVDAHTLLLIKYLRSFAYKENERKFPAAVKLFKKIARPEILYIAGLYHDIGKGRGGNHSQLGAMDAEKFCRRHGLDNENTLLIVWLVKEHLTMSITAQRQDISDSEVIQIFARKVETSEKLDYLYLLTVADINATNALLWNGWRASLLQQLYKETRQMLKVGADNLSSQSDQIKSIKLETLTLIPEISNFMTKVIAFWEHIEPAYFISHEPEEIAWQTRSVITHKNKKPLIIVRGIHDGDDDHWGLKIFVYTHNQKNLFAATVAALDQLNLIIQDARIFTSSNNFGMSIFTVLESDGTAIGKNIKRSDQIQCHLREMLNSPDGFPSLIQRITPRHLRQFSSEPVVSLSSQIKSRATQLNLIAIDRPGLLALIGKTFMELSIDVHRAKIATFGERVEDLFMITGKNGSFLHDYSYCVIICNKLIKVLNVAVEK